ISGAPEDLIASARAACDGATMVAVAAGSNGTAHSADFTLTLPDNLHRLAEILSESCPAAGEIVSERRLEQKLADAQQKMQDVLDQLTEGVAVVDADGRIVRVNRKLVEIYGAPDASAFLGRACHQALWGRLQPCETCPRLCGGESLDESRELDVGGRSLCLDVWAATLEAGRGGAIGMIESIRDATPRLKLEANLLESEKMKVVGVMAARLAHELRNPITIINATAECCLETQDNPELEEAFSSILNATGQAEKIIRDLLSFAGPAPDRFELVSVRELVKTTTNMISAQCRKRRVKLAIALPHRLPTINADRSRLQQALVNFMLNGIEAMRPGGTLTVTAGQAGEAAVEMRITDTGSGMTSEELERVFELFFTTKPDGVGLGMANARKIVKAHQGKVELQSSPGTGTTVAIVLPAAQRVRDAAVATA
ncbi:MAG: PAS domain-containing protein, partial [Planctomycetes bacterium]|nr:PAS domain-containing protein [Planctomycetota bacterium]